MSNRNDYRGLLGIKGEDTACRYLIACGHEILARNYRSKFGEIDIITIKDNKIIFVEVKSRTNEKFGFPNESISSEKVFKILKTGYEFMAERKLKLLFRIDVVSINFNAYSIIIALKHFENIDTFLNSPSWIQIKKLRSEF